MAKELFSTAAETSLDAMYLLRAVRDDSGHIKDFMHEYVNRPTVSGTSISEDEILGKSVLEISPKYIETGLFDELCRVVETGQTLKKSHFESNLIDNAKYGIYDLRASKWNDGCIVVWHDMTDYFKALDKLEVKRLRAETLLKISQELAEADLNFMNILNIVAEKAASLIGDACMIGLTSDESDFIRYAAIFDKDKNAKKSLEDLFTGYRQPRTEGLAGKVLKSEQPILLNQAEIEEVKDIIPEVIWSYLENYGLYSIIVSPMKAHGKISGVIILLRNTPGKPYTKRDSEFLEEIGLIAALAISNAGLYKEIAEKKEKLNNALTELEASNKELQMFSYAVSHDLQEPVRMISNFARLIESKYIEHLDEKASGLFSFITEAAVRLQRMILGILDFSRVYTRGDTFVPIDLNSVLKNSILSLRLKIEETGTVIKSEALPTVMADEVQIERVFQNFIDNAIKFKGTENPQIQIKSKKEADEWIISVKDNGIGINPKNFEQIFAIFQRLHGTEFGGMGIGLAICKRIIERHNGRIWVESEKNKGTTFYFTLPVNSELKSNPL